MIVCNNVSVLVFMMPDALSKRVCLEAVCSNSLLVKRFV
jgi:hypothetical protein